MSISANETEVDEKMVDKHYRLTQQLKMLLSLFRKTPLFSWRIFAKIDYTCQPLGHHYLGIYKRRFGFPDKIAYVYPRRAGGDTQNVYDILVNKEIATVELVRFLETIVRTMACSHPVELGEVKWRDTLEPYTNHIVETNNSYEPRATLPDM